MLQRAAAAAWSLLVVTMASQALHYGGPPAVVAIAVLVHAVAELVSSMLRDQ